MQYKLKKDLPFIKKETIFGTGCWCGGGFGIDLGETKYISGGSSHNGIRTFEVHENKLLEAILNNDEWIEKVPTRSKFQILKLFKEGYYDESECLANLIWL